MTLAKPMMNLELFEQIKKLAIIAMVSNDELMERLVLKGGNAIDLFYNSSSRASIDIDFSMSSEFTEEELTGIRGKVEEVLATTFRQAGYDVFDVKFTEKPENIDGARREFWGGYRIEFKVIPTEDSRKNIENLEFLRRNATVIGPGQKRVFEIEISKFEYCEGKVETEIDGYKLYIYTPEMIVLEKIRAICQQIPEYRRIVKTHDSVARSRDFFDIRVLSEHYSIDLNSKKNKTLLRAMFDIKRVPLSFLNKIKDHREFHRTDFDSVKNTVKSGVKLKEFDYYFNYVVTQVESMKS